MKNLIISISVGLLSGFTVYLLIDYLFERPSKSVKSKKEMDEQALRDDELYNAQNEEDENYNTISLEPSTVGNK